MLCGQSVLAQWSAGVYPAPDPLRRGWADASAHLSVLAHSGYHLAEVDAGLPSLLAADEVVVCNALMPLLPVRRVATQVFSDRTLYQFYYRTACRLRHSGVMAVE